MNMAATKIIRMEFQMAKSKASNGTRVKRLFVMIVANISNIKIPIIVTNECEQQLLICFMRYHTLYTMSMSQISFNSFFAYSHTSHNLYYCNVCGKHFVKESQLKVHMPTHDQDKFSSLKCYLCGSKFDRVHGLRIHFTISHTKRVKRDLRCPLCSKTCSKQNDLDLHIDVVSVILYFMPFCSDFKI